MRSRHGISVDAGWCSGEMERDGAEEGGNEGGMGEGERGNGDGLGCMMGVVLYDSVKGRILFSLALGLPT